MTTMIDPQKGPLPEVLPDAEPTLFQQTVPPRLVRRVYNPDVFVTDLRVTGYNTFGVGVRWPARHGFYGPVTPHLHDPLLFLESIRQAGLLIAQVAFEIPTEFKFITHEKRYDVSPLGLRTDGARPVDVEIIVMAHEIRRRGRGFAGMRFDFTCLRDGVEVGTASYRWSCVSAAGYSRLRGEHATAAPESRQGMLIRPHLVGRSDEIDVMIAEAPGGGWQVAIDPGHPVVFDHHIDHVPGNGAIEVARQAALLATGRPDALPVGGDFSFHHYIEFDKPCRVLASRADARTDRTAVRVSFEQDGHTAADGHFDLLMCG